MRRRHIIALFAIAISALCLGKPIRSANGLDGIERTEEEVESTAKMYIQDGLIAMWDGIENAGWGVHDEEASVWTDLVGRIELSPNEATTNISFDDKSAVLDGSGYFITSNYPEAILQAVNSNNITIEYCIKNQTINISQIISKNLSPRVELWQYPEVYNNQINRTYITWRTSGFSNYCDSSLGGDSGDIFTVAYTIENGHIVKFCNGVFVTQADTVVPSGDISTTARFYLGGNRGPFIGHIFNVRISSRPLTADEIAYNYEVDRIRFNLP